jgi:hypothetical protein
MNFQLALDLLSHYTCKVVKVIELQFVYILRNQVISFKVLIFLFFWTFSPQLNPFYSVRTEDHRPWPHIPHLFFKPFSFILFLFQWTGRHIWVYSKLSFIKRTKTYIQLNKIKDFMKTQLKFQLFKVTAI